VVNMFSVTILTYDLAKDHTPGKVNNDQTPGKVRSTTCAVDMTRNIAAKAAIALKMLQNTKLLKVGGCCAGLLYTIILGKLANMHVATLATGHAHL